VGAQGFADLCQALEQCGDFDQARQIVAQMRPLLERIAKHIREYSGVSN